MPGPKGGGATKFHYEGYRLSFRAKDPKTGKENEVVVYAVGEQQASDNMKPLRLTANEAVVETTDKSLKITTTVRENNGVLEIVRKIMADKELVFERIHIQLESRALACPMLAGLVSGGGECTECQSCGCVGPICNPKLGEYGNGAKTNWARATLSVQTFENGLPHEVTINSSTTPLDVAILSWSKGVNFESLTLRQGQSILIQESIPISREEAGKLPSEY
jgi:hypothetical protein